MAGRAAETAGRAFSRAWSVSLSRRLLQGLPAALGPWFTASGFSPRRAAAGPLSCPDGMVLGQGLRSRPPECTLSL